MRNGKWQRARAGRWVLALAVFAACLPMARARPPAAVVVERAQLHMGTRVAITAVAPTRAVAAAAIDAGFAEVRRLNLLLSTWIPESELSRVNAAAGHKPVRVGVETLAVLARAHEVATLTGGAFDVAIGPAVAAWDFGGAGRIPSAAELAGLAPLVDASRVRVDAQAATVFLARPGMRIDVGGIAKGFAADAAAAEMRAAGATAGIVAVSGDIRTFGRRPDGTPFRFGIQDPRDENGVLATLELEDGALSTAGDYERYFERDGVRHAHILDPRTLRPARACRSVTIVASAGVLADGLDTGIFVMGPERGMDLIERLPDVEGVIVDRDGTVTVSTGLRDRLRFGDSERPLPHQKY